MIVVRALRQRREIGRLRQRELVHRLVEIEQRGGRDAVGADAEIDFVEIELEDPLLRERALDLHREQRFLDLAGQRQFVGQQEVLRDLLGDRRRALRTAAGAVVLDVGKAGARDAREVDAVVLVEALVLGRDERVDDQARYRLDRQVEPALARILGEQLPVGGMHAGHHRGLIVLKLRVVRQLPREVPEDAGHGGDGHQEHDGPAGENPAKEAQHESHDRYPAPGPLRSKIPVVLC